MAADKEIDGQSEVPVLREIAERIGNNAVDRDTESVAGLLARILVGNLTVKSPDGFFTVSASFNRPANTTVYAAGRLISSNPAAPLEFPNVARAAGEAIRIERLRIRSNKTPGSITNGSFVAHIFRKLPTLNVADGAAFNSAGVLAIADIDGYVGTIPVVFNYAAAIGARGSGVPATGSGITCEAAGATGHATSLWVVLEANAAYQPVSGETFTVTLEAARS